MSALSAAASDESKSEAVTDSATDARHAVAKQGWAKVKRVLDRKRKPFVSCSTHHLQ